MTDEQALLRAVLLSPDDDTPRLVYADRLDDLGQHDRAEFIRVQCELARGWNGHSDLSHQGHGDLCRGCVLRRRERELWRERRPDGYTNGYHWFTASAGFSTTLDPFIDGGGRGPNTPLGVVRRGFVAEVRLALAAFVADGGPCDRCRGEGGRHKDKHGHDYWIRCGGCKGTGRAPGLAAVLFKAHPVERVVLVDREPLSNGDDGEYARWAWWDIDPLTETNQGHHPPSNLTPELFALAPGEAIDGDYKEYPTREAALDALSAACVRWGREQAQLPALLG